MSNLAAILNTGELKKFNIDVMKSNLSTLFFIKQIIQLDNLTQKRKDRIKPLTQTKIAQFGQR